MPVDGSAAEAWAALDRPWQECFELAWQSFLDGGIPIAAALTDGGGSVLSRARNQRFAATATATMTGLLGHAELNVLADGLPAAKNREHDAVLYATLQPCPMCLGAVIVARLGRLTFAATDPTWAGVERLPELNHEVLARWPRVDGPLPGRVGLWATALPILNTSGSLLRSLEHSSPNQAARAKQVAVALRATRPHSAVDALDEVWELLTDTET